MTHMTVEIYGSFGHLPSKIVKIRNRHPGVKITPFLNLKKGRSKAWQSAAFDKTDFLFLFSFLKKTIKTKKLFWLDCVAPMHNRWEKTSDLEHLGY